MPRKRDANAAVSWKTSATHSATGEDSAAPHANVSRAAFTDRNEHTLPTGWLFVPSPPEPPSVREVAGVTHSYPHVRASSSPRGGTRRTEHEPQRHRGGLRRVHRSTLEGWEAAIVRAHPW